MRKQIADNRFRSNNIFIYLLIFKVVIEFVYVSYIFPIYSYSGLTLDINIVGYGISTIYLLIMVLFSPKDQLRPSTYLFIIMEVFLFTPMLSFFWLNNKSIIYTSFVILSAIIISLVLKIKPFSFKIKIRNAKFWINYIFVIYILINVYLVLRRGGIDSRAFDFNTIYELRAENELSGTVVYLLNWCAKAFCPFFFTYFYYRKKYSMLLLISILQLSLYLSFGNKSFLFSIILIAMTSYFVKGNKFDYKFINAISGINIVAYILSAFSFTNLFITTIPYRMHFVPAQIQYQYYEFFSITKKMYFADGLIGKIFSIESPYGEATSFMIGRIYSRVGANANTGIFSDAYANAGFIGMIVFAIIFAFILYFVDSVTDRLPLYVVVGAYSYMIIVLVDTSLLTSMLTGGMGIMIFLLVLFNCNIEACNIKDNAIKRSERIMEH